MEREKRVLLRELKNNKSQVITFLNTMKSISVISELSKSSQTSEKFRKNGNDLFLQKGHSAETHREIFINYCQSVINAPNNSEQLAFAYGNRSAFLLHIKKYEDCIKDCNRALKIATNSDNFKIKMLCRKAECLKKLSLSEYDVVIQEAESCRNKLEDESKNKKLMTDAISKVKSLTINKKDHVKTKKVDDIQLEEILDGIKIDHDQIYGRHLIAAKDYKPGDIILVENLFATTVGQNFYYTNCHYCMKLCWSGIPCKYCNTAIFCSEDCRHKAWKLFHDIECSLIPHFILAGQQRELFDTALRAVLIGIREAGSIAQLKDDLKSIAEKSIDEFLDGFIKDGEYTKNRIESVYVLNSDRVPDYILQSLASCVPIILVRLAQCSQLFTDIDLIDVEEFIKNKDVIFVGSLLMKMIAVKSVNDCEFTPKQLYACEKSNSLSQCGQDTCCLRGTCFAPISSLVSHHCFPNAARCFSENRQVILYAVQPIKKDTQVFNSYCGEYDDIPKEQRQLTLQKYQIICNCQPCIESWPTVLHMSEELLEKHSYAIKGQLQDAIYNSCSSIFDALDKRNIDFNKKNIETLSKAIMRATKLKQPTLLMCYLVESLKRVFSHVYGLKLQLPSFGQCRR